jgi:hypothetical protein
MKKLLLFLFLLVQLFYAQAQDPLFTALSDRKWGLSEFREVRGFEEDTLFSLRNCEKEYLILRRDGQFEYATGVKLRHGKWSVNQDSIISLKKSDGKILVQFKILKLDETKLKVSETQRLNIFVHEYTLCGENEKEVFDSRPEFYEKKIHALVIGGQGSRITNMFEAGYTRAFIAWNEQAYLLQVLAEVNTWNKNLFRTQTVVVPDSVGPDYEIQVPRENIYGLHVNFMTQRLFAGGVGLSANTNGKKVQFGVRPIIGISFKFLGDIGALSSLTYSYNFLFIKDGFNVPIEDLNRGSVSLRIGIPVKKYYRKVNKMVFRDE